jgi:hypothetical protein
MKQNIHSPRGFQGLSIASAKSSSRTMVRRAMSKLAKDKKSRQAKGLKIGGGHVNY